MKRRHLIWINLVFIALMVFASGVAYQFMTGKKPLNAVKDAIDPPKAVTVATANCSTKAAVSLQGVQNGELQKLAVYQQACHSFVTGTMMVFVGMPMSADSAAKSAQTDAAMLKEFAKYHVRPLVMAEPTDYVTSANLDFGQFAAGAYQPWLNQYFAALKASGVTDSQMGIWNPFPEANLPYWANNQPQYFAPDVNAYIATLRKYFPAAQTSIMLNSATYQTTDFNWANGEYDSWLQYIKGIAPGSINFAGIEGFPWVPPAGGNGAILNAAEFLDPSIISEAATYLGTKDIWFNTGTFSQKYTLDPSKLAYITPEQRKEILATVDQQVLVLQKQGFQVAVNMFAQDKSQTSEETDWSYWGGNRPFSSLATPVLTDFVSQLNAQKADFWLFDK